METATEISIPLWFDWGPTAGGSDGRLEGFQSHFGSIGAAAAFSAPLPREKISIPLWFDWGLEGLESAHPRALFQSHFGSIGACWCWRLAGGAGAAFQSHFGSIGAPTRAPCWGSSVRISIPLWFDWGCLGFNPIVAADALFQSHFGSIGAIT